MASITTEIKNIIAGHLQLSMWGYDIYGRHEQTIFDGTQDRVLIIEVAAPNRFVKIGCVTVWHPTYGKWTARLLSKNHTGKPVQMFTAEQIKESISTTPTLNFIHKVYCVETPKAEPVFVDPYWQASDNR